MAISREEAVKSPELMVVFDRFDANGDGYLDRAEFQRARDLIREQERTQDRGHQPRRH